MNKITSKVRVVVGRVKGRNSETPGTDPPPYIHDRTYRISRLLSMVLLTFLLLLSIPALVLKVYGYNFIEINGEMGFYLVNKESPGGGNHAGDNLVAALPHNIFRVPEKLVLVVAMLNILLSMAHLGFVVWDWRTQTRSFRRNAMVLHVVNSVFVLSALIGMSVAHRDSSTFQYQLIPTEPNAVSPSGYRYYRYDAGIFDLETWTCELMNAPAVGDAMKDYSAQCQIEVAGRMILVPFFLAAIALAGLSIWALIVGGKPRSHNEQLYTKDMDLEAAKQVQVVEVELDTLKPERQVDARLSKIEEDTEEPEEAPKEAILPVKAMETTTESVGRTNEATESRIGAPQPPQ
ncbi:hypothetical protein E8E12_010735 [Didymella heteroderae]|uniref:Uncharacterized protein n=1 Tax=Didymella heteroderae TaxID=1769908 RepID=A0A9P4WWJ2_9PLEO|nr:hypothetical protein E8E12_010735 [Didymella heteroderae]